MSAGEESNPWKVILILLYLNEICGQMSRFFSLSRKEITLMTAASNSSVATVDTSDCDSPEEIREAFKSPLLCQQGRLGDCSWTVRHPDTA